ncbi:MAG: c-type cytochrome [Gammaproteobacteria bacterium]
MQTVRTVIFTFVILTIIFLIGVIIFIYSGIFDVSAQHKENPLWHWLADTTRKRSIAVRAVEIKAPSNLNDPAVLMEGSNHYQEMCVECHRAPGLTDSETSKGLNPSPPNFSQMKNLDLSPAEIFWIIKNGIRMTGMPSWGVTHDDEKIWALTAFVRKLPHMTPAEYQAITGKTKSTEEHHMH